MGIGAVLGGMHGVVSEPVFSGAEEKPQRIEELLKISREADQFRTLKEHPGFKTLVAQLEDEQGRTVELLLDVDATKAADVIRLQERIKALALLLKITNAEVALGDQAAAEIRALESAHRERIL